MKRNLAGVLLVLAGFGLLAIGPCRMQGAEFKSLDLARLRLPPGFKIEVFARIDNAREMTAGPAGVVFVGNRQGHNVYAAVDADGDGGAERVLTVATGLTMPNGVAYKDGDLYVSEISRILRFRGIDRKLENPGPPEVVVDNYPTSESHGWKFIAFGPDGKLYVPVGAPCNICSPQDPIFMTITRLNPDGSGREIFAKGIRNTVGFDWDDSGTLWFTENGRDWMGDNEPPDELNRADRPGLDFGFPACHGDGIPDPKFNRGRDCAAAEKPRALFGAHVAALGMRFYRGPMFPEKYRGGIFVAQHGSWNRSVPDGYRVMFVPVKDGKAGAPEIFAEGWLQDGKAWGRPVDVLPLADGSLLVSDDEGDAVYRVSYTGK